MPRMLSCSLLTAALAAAPLARADRDCRVSDFRGVYSAIASGEFIATPPGIPEGPTARVGRVEVDGYGGASIRATLSLSGFILKEEYGGSYTVNPDCTMLVTLLIPFPGVPAPVPFRFFGMLAEDARELAILLLDPPGSSVRIVLRKQRKDDCANSDLNGAFLLNMSGVNVAQPGLRPGPFARVGRMRFDGKGGFTAAARASSAGQISEEAFNGTYTVDPSCTFSLLFKLREQPFEWSGMLKDTGGGADVLVSSPPGAVITGTLKQQ